ncbi:MAG: tetratricopeptide repeat protein, partial [Candidatus Hydrogenedentes bacterium]|nr:tetratricopeptide repeat protein [Candidatus Hydrogenedentota bacterium]
VQAASNAALAGKAEAYREHEAKAEEMFEKARRLFEQAGGMELRDTEALADFAGVLHSLNDSDLAAEALRKATRLEPDNPALWLALGRGLLAPLYRKPAEAEKALKRAAETGGGKRVEGEARAVLGRLYWDKGLVDLAESEWSRALEMAPENALAQMGMAAVLARRGEVVAASERVEQVAKAAPSGLALAEELLGKSLRDFERSGLWIEDTADAHFAYASLLLRAGRYVETIGPLRRAAKLEPGNHVVWNMIGSISAQLGRTEQAREAFQRSLDINPDQARTREALKELLLPESKEKEEGAPSESNGGEGSPSEPQGSGTVSPGASK